MVLNLFPESRVYEPKAALVLYADPENPAATLPALVRFREGRPASVHAPTAGTLRRFARQLLSQQETQGVRFLHPRVVAEGEGLMAWWRPAGPAVLHFTMPALHEVSGKSFPLPPLLFVLKGGEVFVFALPKDARPEPDTPLLAAPFPNRNANGWVCWGSGRRPSRKTPEAWEAAFFESAFSHLNDNPVQGNLVALLKSLPGRRRFPVSRLKKLGLTVREVLRRLA